MEKLSVLGPCEETECTENLWRSWVHQDPVEKLSVLGLWGEVDPHYSKHQARPGGLQGNNWFTNLSHQFENFQVEMFIHSGAVLISNLEWLRKKKSFNQEKVKPIMSPADGSYWEIGNVFSVHTQPPANSSQLISFLPANFHPNGFLQKNTETQAEFPSGSCYSSLCRPKHSELLSVKQCLGDIHHICRGSLFDLLPGAEITPVLSLIHPELSTSQH